MSDGKVNTFTLSGESKVRADNDIAQFTVTVVSHDKNFEKAMTNNSEKMQIIFGILEKAGVNKRDYQTSGIHYGAWMVQVTKGKGKKCTTTYIKKGHQVDNTLEIIVRDLAGIAGIYSAIAATEPSGIGSPRFECSDPAKLMDEARKAALQNAIDKAKVYALTAKVELLGIISFNETHTTYAETSGAVGAPGAQGPQGYQGAPGAVGIATGSKELIVKVSCIFEVSSFRSGSFTVS